MSKLADVLARLRAGEEALAASLRAVAVKHADEPEIFHTCGTLAGLSEKHVGKLEGADVNAVPASPVPTVTPRDGGFGALLDLQDIYAAASHVQAGWTLVSQSAQAARDDQLLALSTSCSQETQRQLSWLTTQLKAAAAQAVLAAP